MSARHQHRTCMHTDTRYPITNPIHSFYYLSERQNCVVNELRNNLVDFENRNRLIDSSIDRLLHALFLWHSRCIIGTRTCAHQFAVAGPSSQHSGGAHRNKSQCREVVFAQRRCERRRPIYQKQTLLGDWTHQLLFVVECSPAISNA